MERYDECISRGLAWENSLQQTVVPPGRRRFTEILSCRVDSWLSISLLWFEVRDNEYPLPCSGLTWSDSALISLKRAMSIAVDHALPVSDHRRVAVHFSAIGKVYYYYYDYYDDDDFILSSHFDS